MKFELPHNFDNEIQKVGLRVVIELRALIRKLIELDLDVTGQEIFMHVGENEDAPYEKVQVTAVRIFDDENAPCLKFTLKDVPECFGELEYDATDLQAHELVSLYSQYYAHNISTIKAVG